MHVNRLLCHLPAQRIAAADIIHEAGETPMQGRIFSKLTGFEAVAAYESPRAVAAAWGSLLDQLAVQPSPDAVIHVHGLPVPTTLPLHPWMTGAAQYEIDQFNCASLFWGLDLAERLLRRKQARQVLLLVGDEMSAWPLVHRYLPGCSLMGDACVALLLDDEPGGLRLLPPGLARRNQHHHGLYGLPEERQAFYQAHDEMVQSLLADLDCQSHDITLLPHNINSISWVQYSRRYGLPLTRIRRDLLPSTGHCYCADPLLLLRRWLDDGGRGEAVMLSVGFGAYGGACRVKGTV